jgi:hypothetical protein
VTPLLLILASALFAAEPSPEPGTSAYERAMRRGFLASTRAHIRLQESNGVFRISDEETRREWFLKLLHLRRDKVVARKDGTYFTCVEFQSIEARPHRVDVDFYARKTGDAWKVEKAAIHKVDERPRFVYDADQKPAAPPQ